MITRALIDAEIEAGLAHKSLIEAVTPYVPDYYREIVIKSAIRRLRGVLQLLEQETASETLEAAE